MHTITATRRRAAAAALAVLLTAALTAMGASAPAFAKAAGDKKVEVIK
ncbi:hypothetical protein ACN20G_32875 (plasmid) [Streptomyces sp. BI20]